MLVTLIVDKPVDAEPAAPARVAMTPPAPAVQAGATLPPPPLPETAPRSPASEATPVPQAGQPAQVSATTPAEAQAVVSAAAKPSMAPASEPASAPPGSLLGADRGPQLLGEVDPEMPSAAGRRGGTVTLRFVVSERGEVESVEIVRSQPAGLFDAAVLAAARQARFSPAVKAGASVRGEVLYEIVIDPVGRGTDASSRSY